MRPVYLAILALYVAVAASPPHDIECGTITDYDFTYVPLANEQSWPSSGASYLSLAAHEHISVADTVESLNILDDVRLHSTGNKYLGGLFGEIQQGLETPSFGIGVWTHAVVGKEIMVS